MNQFVAQNPAVVIAFTTLLWGAFTFVLVVAGRVGYTSVMKRFDNIEGDEEDNRREHGEIKERLVRIETLVVNGGKE